MSVVMRSMQKKLCHDPDDERPGNEESHGRDS